jgi:hypothetical protein
MQSRNKRPFAVTKIDELFPSKSPPVHNAAAEALQSQLIDAFEAALCRGMNPLDALAIILGWASSEIGRVRVDRNDGSN